MRATTLASILGVAALCGVAIHFAPARADAEACALRVEPGADVQEALDGIGRDGRPATLCLGAGEFTLPRRLSIDRDGLGLRGEGPGTVLRLADGTESPVIVIGDYRHQIPATPTSGVTVERLRIVGNGTSGSEFDAEYRYLTNSALVIRGGRSVAVRALDVSACRSACILTEHDSRDVSIEGSTIGGSTWDGVALNRTSRSRVAGNTIRDNRAAGITAEHLEDSVIEDNTITGNRSQGVYLADSYRNRFRGNRFVDNTNAGVFLTCSVRQRDPEPARCWDDSMSQANRFERNEFVGNRLGYIVAADAAANCTKAGVIPNVTRGDDFVRNPSVEQDRTVYGECLRQEDEEASGLAGGR